MRTPDWQSDDGAIQLHCCDCLALLPTIPAGFERTRDLPAREAVRS